MTAPPLTNDEIRRYSRHILLPEIGRAGQERLKGARVLLIGAGGLGSPMALYLAAAGVGTIGICDFDRVDLTNLQRQVLFTSSDVGQPKVEAAARRLRALNPDLDVRLHPDRLVAARALALFRDYEIVADGADNFATRYLVNDAAFFAGIPNVYGSIHRFEGQVTVFDARRGPCYRCLFPSPPPPNLIGNCAEAGVLGILPGVVGLLQATEVVKAILGLGESLVGRLVLYDALALRFRELRIKKNADCPLCSETPRIRAIEDLEVACGAPEPEPETKGEPTVSGNDREIAPTEVRAKEARKEDFFLLDVREPEEFDICKIRGAVLIPLGELAMRSAEVPKDREVIVVCHHGNRSRTAQNFLLRAGFPNVKNLTGGIDRWSETVDPGMPRY